MNLFKHVILVSSLAVYGFAQEEGKQPQNSEASAPEAIPSAQPQPTGSKRIFGVLPNYRTAEHAEQDTTLNASQKLYVARKDSFDYPLVALSAGLAGLSQITDQQPSFGQGVKGYGHRLATNYADQTVSTLFTEGLFPALLHEDPRYFRRAEGNAWSRAWYAASRVFVTHKDGGAPRFNYSEWLGNASAVAISNAYYPDNRKLGDNGIKLLEMVGTDAASQVLREFWPDLKRKLFGNKHD